MQPQRAVLVNRSRLMRELVKRMIERTSGFEVIREIGDIRELTSAIDANVEWAFVILMPGREIPESLKVELFLKHPALRLVGLWVDGSHARLEWLARQHVDLTGLTLDDLNRLLLDELQKTRLALEEKKDRG